jgi:hypothetical protein
MSPSSEFDFTAAATDALDLYLAGLRRSILTTAIEIAARENNSRIDAGLVERAIAESQELSRPGGRPSSRKRLSRVRLIALLATILLALTAVGIVSATSEHIRASVWLTIISSIGVLLGATAAVLAWSTLPSNAQDLAKSRNTGAALFADSAIEFLGQWQQFERALRSIMPGLADGGVQRRRTLSEDIRIAIDAGYIDGEEIGDVRRLLSTRNGLAHGELVGDPAALAVDSDRLATIVRRMLARAEARDAAAGNDHS